MVRIVNWLLTRRCNMSCEYCGIVKGVKEKLSHFKKNEMSTERVITLLDKFSKYNPDIFHIFYGGEPFLRGDLEDILRFCNEAQINYTVISNCSPDVQPKIRNVIRNIGVIKGFSASVDPSVISTPDDSHSQRKSSWGFHFLMKMKHHVDDAVAEVTMTRPTLGHTYDLIKMLSRVNIYTSLTAIDVNKNYSYDFSAYSSTNHLLKHNKYLDSVYEKIMSDDSLLIHMKEIVVPQLFRHIDSTYDCQQGSIIHNLTIDADGAIRMCLRSKGYLIDKFDDSNVLIMTEPYGYEINPLVTDAMIVDKTHLCKGCNHTCVMMSKYINDTEDSQRITDH